ncbi:L-threonylcarbamoyladenylate synthase [Breznakiella homolactica]|uniref:Threonylcarbamoyl-AMP synthase n=1 Tax=Breznakiella homolactica TaxID=2798577 RepID=A0A7T7XMI4_9SPIR|nr:L-threonylcarbamoyladenylate synthase [Breznakiella homolactica]QQO09106.1 threonylcarbamoyl-AMP synthase [Breznakiella homolactica]
MEMLSDSEDDLCRAAAALRSGDLVAFPTETVYGLGGDAFNPAALAKIFEAKQRPRFDPLIIHIAEVSVLERVADLTALDAEMRKALDILSAELWPGPLTLVLPKKNSVPDLATSGLPTAAVRLPDHPVALKIIRYSTGAVAAPSANPFGYLSPTRAEHVAEQLGGRVDYIVDGGKVRVGVESTVLDISGRRARILRPGGMPRERIEELIGPVDTAAAEGPLPAAPGQLKSHYAPRTGLYLYSPEAMMAVPWNKSEAFVFFDGKFRDQWIAGNRLEESSGGVPANIRVLSESGSMNEAAANLFDFLHELDNPQYTAIRAVEVPETGLGPAVNDRLRKARAEAKDNPQPYQGQTG